MYKIYKIEIDRMTPLLELIGFTPPSVVSLGLPQGAHSMAEPQQIEALYEPEIFLQKYSKRFRRKFLHATELQ